MNDGLPTTHVSQYHAALARLADDPLTVTERDFALFLEYGGKHQVAEARKAFDAAVAPVVPRPAQPAGTAVTRAQLDRTTEAIVTFFAKILKRDIGPRLVALEQRLAAVDGIAPPTGPAREKPKVKLAGEWTRKMFEPGVGVTHDGKLFHCLRTTFTEPSKDPTSWEQVA